MLRFIHAADFHLDSRPDPPAGGRPPPGEPGAAGASG